MIIDPSSKIGEGEEEAVVRVTLLRENSGSEGEEVTTRRRPGERVGRVVPEGRDRRVERERGIGHNWYRRRDRAGWPERRKAASVGAKTVRVGGDARVRVWETRERVRDMETWPESERISAASRTVLEGRGEARGRRERRPRKAIRSEAAIDGA